MKTPAARESTEPFFRILAAIGSHIRLTRAKVQCDQDGVEFL